jgi:hypothetical protein
VGVEPTEGTRAQPVVVLVRIVGRALIRQAGRRRLMPGRREVGGPSGVARPPLHTVPGRAHSAAVLGPRIFGEGAPTHP